jgi:AhpD family alkylhydroperoxidase
MYDLSNLKKLSRLTELTPKAMESFKEFDRAALADGAISKKNKELIAIAVALTTQCAYCLEIHRKAAYAEGASEEEIGEVIFISAALRAGAAVTHGTHLLANPPI